MRAAIYIRVSSAGQEDNYSLGTQDRDCRAYCTERGYQVFDIYREVYTGVELEGRPELSRLRADLAERRVDVVVVWHSDRLSRDPDDRVYLRVEASRQKVRYESVKDPLGGTDEDKLVEYLRGWAAKVEWRRIRERSVAGTRSRVQSGKLIGSGPPRYGYRWSDAVGDQGRPMRDRYLEDSATAVWVRYIFEQVAAGTPIRTLIRDLERRGVKTSRGRDRWTSFTVGNLIKSPMYKGEAYLFQVATGKDETGRRTRKRRPESEWVRLPDGVVPPLVSPELWRRANDRLARAIENRATRNYHDDTPLDVLSRGRVRCAHCGCKLHVKRHRRDGVFFNCQSRARGVDCPGCMIKAETLDRAVWERVTWVSTDPGLIMDEFRRQQDSEHAAAEIATLEREIERARAREQSFAEALGAGLAGPALKVAVAKLNEASAHRETLERRRAEIEEQRRLVERESAVVRDWLEVWVREVDRNRDLGFEERQARLSQLGVEITVAKTGSGLPRYEIAMNIPVDIRNAMRRDPDGGFLPMSDEEYAFALDPTDRSPEQVAAAGRYIKATGYPQSLEPEPGTAPGSHQSRNTPLVPSSPALCGGTAGGSPRRSRRGRRGRFRW